MKTLLTLVSMLVMLTGCASEQAYQTYNDAYRQNAIGYYEASSKPLVDITLPSPDKLNPYHIVVNREVKQMVPEQIKNSEWTGPLNGLISAAGMVGGIWAGGEALDKITKNSGSNSSYVNSGTQSTRRDTLSNTGDGTVSASNPTTIAPVTTTSTGNTTTP